jgi:hypothetical protein
MAAGAAAAAAAGAAPRVVPVPTQSLAEMKAAHVAWLEDRRPDATKRTYGSALDSWKEWCEGKGYSTEPADGMAPLVATYMRHLRDERGLATGTINSTHAAAIASTYRFEGIPSPTLDPLVAATKHAIATDPRAPAVRHRKPIPTRDVAKVVEYANNKKTC